MTTVDTAPATEQRDHFEVTTTTWRGQINSEDVTVQSLMDVLLLAREAGMPGNALVRLRPGDCVVVVEVQVASLKPLS